MLRTSLNPSERIRRYSSSKAVVRGLHSSWRWRITQWVAEEGIFCFLRVMKGGDEAELMVS
jgi:hypothetical protein